MILSAMGLILNAFAGPHQVPACSSPLFPEVSVVDHQRMQGNFAAGTAENEKSANGRVGRRTSRGQSSPAGELALRTDSRIRNRIENRVESRIDKDHRPPETFSAQFEAAKDDQRGSSEPQ